MLTEGNKLLIKGQFRSYNSYENERNKLILTVFAKDVEELEEVEEQEEQIRKEPENVMNLISVEPMEVEIGYGLIPLADERNGGDLLQQPSV